MDLSFCLCPYQECSNKEHILRRSGKREGNRASEKFTRTNGIQGFVRDYLYSDRDKTKILLIHFL